ncbi:MAG: hypothetical protein MZW92_39385 [Comamonadaceae bacterium]|nr:hypothetical protein [Comamonadaceae bacterium]
MLFLLACGLVLYAFMLNVDLGDVKRRLSKEVETRQQTERYLIESRNQLTNSLREVEQLKAQLAYKETRLSWRRFPPSPRCRVVVELPFLDCWARAWLR